MAMFDFFALIDMHTDSSPTVYFTHTICFYASQSLNAIQYIL